MKFSILEHTKLEQIPSGSGIVKFGADYFVISDDSPYLFTLNKQFKVISKTAIVETYDDTTSRIIKPEKPDFETLEMIDKKELVVFGSGSKSPQRDLFIRILLEDPMIIERYNISDFYQKLKNLSIFSDSELNLEATAYHNNKIYLFNRKKNLIIRFDYQDLLAYLKGFIPFPEPVISEYSLPKIKGIEAGFSGATTLKNESTIIFTASVENTINAYDDGEILGSFIGSIDISNDIPVPNFDYCLIPNTLANFKVESVTVVEEISCGKTRVVLITDDDKGNSYILDGILLW